MRLSLRLLLGKRGVACATTTKPTPARFDGSSEQAQR